MTRRGAPGAAAENPPLGPVPGTATIALGIEATRTLPAPIGRGDDGADAVPRVAGSQPVRARDGTADLRATAHRCASQRCQRYRVGDFLPGDLLGSAVSASETVASPPRPAGSLSMRIAGLGRADVAGDVLRTRNQRKWRPLGERARVERDTR